MCAKLVDEPYSLKPWEIGRLDRFWLHYIYWHPKDDKGGLILAPKPSTALEEDNTTNANAIFASKRREWRWPDWLIEARWRDECEREKQRLAGRKALMAERIARSKAKQEEMAHGGARPQRQGKHSAGA